MSTPTLPGNAPDPTQTEAAPSAPTTGPQSGDVLQSEAVKAAIAEAVEKARAQEKDKMYGRLSKAEEGWQAVQKELAEQRDSRQADVAAAEKKAKGAADEARKKAEAEMDLRQLMETRQSEWDQQLAAKEEVWNQRFSTIAAERETEQAALSKEREFAALREFTQRRVTEESGAIAPELLDFVGGNTESEINASIESVKSKSAAIVEAMQAATQQQRAQMRGTAPTGYSSTGPMDTNSTNQTISADDIRNMSMNDYAKNRGSLLGGATQRSNQGLFG